MDIAALLAVHQSAHYEPLMLVEAKVKGLMDISYHVGYSIDIRQNCGTTAKGLVLSDLCRSVTYVPQLTSALGYEINQGEVCIAGWLSVAS